MPAGLAGDVCLWTAAAAGERRRNQKIRWGTWGGGGRRTQLLLTRGAQGWGPGRHWHGGEPARAGGGKKGRDGDVQAASEPAAGAEGKTEPRSPDAGGSTHLRQSKLQVAAMGSRRVFYIMSSGLAPLFGAPAASRGAGSSGPLLLLLLSRGVSRPLVQNPLKPLPTLAEGQMAAQSVCSFPNTHRPPPSSLHLTAGPQGSRPRNVGGSDVGGSGLRAAGGQRDEGEAMGLKFSHSLLPRRLCGCLSVFSLPAHRGHFFFLFFFFKGVSFPN